MVEDLFETQPVGVIEHNLDEVSEDTVALIQNEEIIATSPISALNEMILLVNSDLFRTGARTIKEIDLPAVIKELDEIPFHLRGYPESHKEKLLLIVISRYIERIAWIHQSGSIRSSFQNLSRLNDEKGTKQVYERLAGSDVDVHLYGKPDWIPPMDLCSATHIGNSPDFDVWFVVYTPPQNGSIDEYAALVAVEIGANEWEGFWTFQPSKVKEINAYIEHNM
ncbi:MAG: histidine kinase [Halobacteriaceae archaeon]